MKEIILLAVMLVIEFVILCYLVKKWLNTGYAKKHAELQQLLLKVSNENYILRCRLYGDWINVAKAPEKYDDYYCATKEGTGEIVHYNQNGWNTSYHVVYWRPLPTLPKDIDKLD